jgi:hypothetical protein
LLLPCWSRAAGQLDNTEEMFNFDPPGGFIHGTDKDGRFTIKGLLPDLKMVFYSGKVMTLYPETLIEDITLKAGEVRDVGDVVPKSSE